MQLVDWKAIDDLSDGADNKSELLATCKRRQNNVLFLPRDVTCTRCMLRQLHQFADALANVH